MTNKELKQTPTHKLWNFYVAEKDDKKAERILEEIKRRDWCTR